MKRIGYIFDKIVDINNIELAIYHASAGKSRRRSVDKILDSPSYYAKEIQNLLLNKAYNPSPYVEMIIHDGNHKKERIVYKPAFYPDQVVHWALMQQIEPILRRGMYDWCCASIKHRGLHYGMKKIKKILVEDRKNTKYCLKLDIRKFYPSINKECLKNKFANLIKDCDTLWLINEIIDSVDSGVPIGNYTSQWFANFYLQDLDHYIKEDLKIKYYIRYMDDMVLFSNNKKRLHLAKKQISDFIAHDYLKLKDNWQLFKVDSRPLDFLGYRFYRGYTTLRRGNFLRIKRRVKKVYKKTKLNFHDASAILSYNGWLKHANSYHYIHRYIKPYIDYELCKNVVRETIKTMVN
ncbi:MAG: RNA-directed DNA polymerase [Bacilli bacterium]|nr:RNA-directed DNA polymerase [Bacilli bacterium]